MANPVVTFEMENGDIIKRNYTRRSPRTQSEILFLLSARDSMMGSFSQSDPWIYDSGRMPDGTGMGGPGYSIKGEFAQNGVANDLKHTPGVLSNGPLHASGFRRKSVLYHAQGRSPSGRRIRFLR